MSEQNPWEKILNQQKLLFKAYNLPQNAAFRLPPFNFPKLKIPEFNLGPWHRISENIARFHEPFERIATFFKRYSWVEDAGWIMHESMPTVVEEGEKIEIAQLDAMIAQHYLENWQEVAKQLSDSVSAFDIDDEAKATFEEALAAHEQGFFRVSPRLLYPEIERIARIEIYSGKIDKMASLDKLRDHLGELDMHDLSDDDFLGGLRFYLKLESHMYSSAKNLKLLEKIEADPVPNRHAAVHGYVSYNTHKSSVNSILIAHFMYRLIALIKSRIQLTEP